MDMGHSAHDAPELVADRAGQSVRAAVLHPGPAVLHLAPVRGDAVLRRGAGGVDLRQLCHRRGQLPARGRDRRHDVRDPNGRAQSGLLVLRIRGDVSIRDVCRGRDATSPNRAGRGGDVHHRPDAGQPIPRPRGPAQVQHLCAARFHGRRGGLADANLVRPADHDVLLAMHWAECGDDRILDHSSPGDRRQGWGAPLVSPDAGPRRARGR